jgi:hypothetical protein
MQNRDFLEMACRPQKRLPMTLGAFIAQSCGTMPAGGGALPIPFRKFLRARPTGCVHAMCRRFDGAVCGAYRDGVHASLPGLEH